MLSGLVLGNDSGQGNDASHGLGQFQVVQGLLRRSERSDKPQPKLLRAQAPQHMHTCTAHQPHAIKRSRSMLPERLRPQALPVLRRMNLRKLFSQKHSLAKTAADYTA